MPDNPYRSPGEVCATKPGADEVRKALQDPSSVAPPGESADDAGISSEAALKHPGVTLVRRSGFALRDVGRMRNTILLAVAGVVLIGGAVVTFMELRDALVPMLLMAVFVGLAVAYWLLPSPAMVIDSRGIWIVRRLRTDFCEWVALRKATLMELVPGAGKEVVLTLKGPEYAKYDKHTFSGRLRRPDTNRIRIGELGEDPTPPAPGFRLGAFEPFDKGGDAGLGMRPDYKPLDELADLIEVCIAAFGTPDDVVVSNSLLESVVLDEDEFDVSESERRALPHPTDSVAKFDDDE